MTDPHDTDPDPTRDAPPTATAADGGDEDSELDGHLALEIPLDLLEAALASVDKVKRPRASPPPPRAGVEIELEPPRAEPTPAPIARRPDPPDERILKLQARIREQSERLLRVDQELRTLVDARAVADAQLGELRNALRVQSDDFDRFRQRARKEREEAEKVGEERALKAFIDTAGNVERAWHHVQSGEAQLMSGLHMIVEQFRAVLRRSGVERIPATAGMQFDPELHEAVLHVASADYAPGQIVDEATPGWRLRGRLFKAARVTVAAPPEPPSEPGADATYEAPSGVALLPDDEFDSSEGEPSPRVSPPQEHEE